MLSRKLLRAVVGHTSALMALPPTGFGHIVRWIEGPLIEQRLWPPSLVRVVGGPWCGLAQPIGLEVVLPLRLSPRCTKAAGASDSQCPRCCMFLAQKGSDDEPTLDLRASAKVKSDSTASTIGYVVTNDQIERLSEPGRPDQETPRQEQVGRFRVVRVLGQGGRHGLSSIRSASGSRGGAQGPALRR
jgi:hypothetical protein